MQAPNLVTDMVGMEAYMVDSMFTDQVEPPLIRVEIRAVYMVPNHSPLYAIVSTDAGDIVSLKLTDLKTKDTDA